MIVPLGRWELSLIRRIWKSKGTCRKRGSLVSFPFSSPSPQPCPQEVGGERRGFFRVLGEFSQTFDYRRKSWAQKSDGEGEPEGVEGIRWQKKDVCGMRPLDLESD